MRVATLQRHVIVHFDEDDFSGPGRIADQVERLVAAGKRAVMTGVSQMIFANPETREPWLYKVSAITACGTSMCYWRTWWEQHRSPDRQLGAKTSH
jgi:hypothetical protein